MADCYIYDAVRTPRTKGRAGGAMNGVKPVDLAVAALRGLEERHDLDTSQLDDVILGCVEPVGEQGGNIARIAALYAGYDQSVPGVQLNRFCSSGLVAVNLAAARVMSGMSDAVVGGGVESMSRIPMGAAGGAWATDPAIANALYFVPQGVSADLVSTLYGYTREQCDALAVESQRRAAQAWKEGRFSKSIVPVKDQSGVLIADRDDFMRPETTLETLAKLKPSFTQMGEQYGFDAVAMQRYPELEKINHMHHAGNSSGIVDGASAVLVGSKEYGERNGLKPRARIRSFADVGSEPTIMLTGPADASLKALKLAGMTTSDIDLFEINEAFASVVLRFQEVLGLDPSIVNVNGGAIALGHPLGATGGMLIGTVLDELERTDKATGLITLCVGAGMGTATIIERV